MAEQARYLYAISRGLDGAALAGETGVGESPIEVVGHGGLDAVVSTVDLAEFGEEALRRNLEDLAWLERVARRHDDVVHAVARHGPAAPLRLATICLGDDGVRRRLDEWHEAMTTVLDRIDGRSEWSVKVVLPKRPATEPAGGAEGTSGPGSGAAYLTRKKRETELRATADRDAAAQADRVYDALGRASVAGRRLQPQDPRLSGHQGTMTLNAAFLVDDAASTAFTDAVAAISAELPDGALQVAGPWPPYSFATLDTP
jgi:Gas vesicle synthesis protein GvpL/GvpF